MGGKVYGFLSNCYPIVKLTVIRIRDKIPSLTVEQKKTLQTQYLYGLAAVFLLSRTIVIYSFPLLFF